MNPALAHEFEQVYAQNAPRTKLSCEDPVRVAALTLSHARDDEITATTVVGVLGLDDVAAFRALVSSIADEFSLDADVRLSIGSYSVRLRRQVDADSTTQSSISSLGPPLQQLMVADGLCGRVLRFLEHHVEPRRGARA